MHLQRLARAHLPGRRSERANRQRPCRSARRRHRRRVVRAGLLPLGAILAVTAGTLTRQPLAGAGVAVLLLVMVALRRRRRAPVPGPGWPGGGGSGGTAGVREPRRPHPSPPAGALGPAAAGAAGRRRGCARLTDEPTLAAHRSPLPLLQ